MSEDEQDTTSTPEPEMADIAAVADDATAQPSASTDADADARIAELERLLATERDAATDYMQRWQRAVADFTNFKRRSQQDQEQRERLVAAQALAPVLSALDGFERAFSALPDSLRGYTWIEGVALVDYQLRHALEAQGITEVAAEPGQPFDPLRHHAVGEVATDQHPAGHIAVVVQRGYEASGLLVRPALVQVARAPEVAPTAETATPDTAAAPEETQPSGPAP